MVIKANKSSKAEVHSQLHSPNVGLLELCSLISMFFCFYFHFLHINLIVQPIQNDSSFNDFTQDEAVWLEAGMCLLPLVSGGAKFRHFLSHCYLCSLQHRHRKLHYKILNVPFHHQSQWFWVNLILWKKKFNKVAKTATKNHHCLVLVEHWYTPWPSLSATGLLLHKT